MSKKTKSSESMPPKVEILISGIGKNIQAARKKRRMSILELATNSNVSRNTITRLENGDSGVSLGVLGAVLWSLQLEEDLANIANPSNDTVGQSLSTQTKKGNKYDF